MFVEIAQNEVPDMEDQKQPGVIAGATAANLRWFNALLDGAADDLNDLLTDDWTFYHPFGGSETKANFIEGIASGKAKYSSLQLEETLVRLHGETAIVTGRLNIQFQWENEQPIQEHSYYTAVYGLYSTGWRMLAWHATTRTEDQG